MSSDLFSYDFYSIAHQHLRDTLGSDKAEFKADQLEAILSIVEHRKKLLLVQRTGWGKSMVYFIATKILRDPEYYSLHLGFENKSPGTVLMISPLLSLMRNQVLEGSSLIEIGRIDSSINQGERDLVAEKFLNSELDMLITTPEQLAKEEFRNNILIPKSSNMSLIIVDEAHCISDWGHDFRPDYMRIRSLISGLPQQTPVIATTATANDRVIEDIVKQMGQSIEVSRGKLTRKSIHLQAFDLPSHEERLALLVDIINEIRLPGIVYVSTTNKTEIVAEWLKQNGIKAKHYTGENSTIDREKIEREFLNDDIQVVVATKALGMGFNKLNLGFVIHFNTPQSPIDYYQQVGRAGRALDKAYGICFLGAEDETINKYFIEKAFPKRESFQSVINCLEKADRPMKESEMQFKCNISAQGLKKLLKIMGSLDGSPIIKEDNKWVRTTNSFDIDWEEVQEIEDKRKNEWNNMKVYINSKSCLMQFLAKNLSDSDAEVCGKCSNCNPLSTFKLKNKGLISKATKFLKRENISIETRSIWMQGQYEFKEWPHFRGNISDEHKLETGKALCFLSDPIYGPLILQGKQDQTFSDELIKASIDEVLNMNSWIERQHITHLCCVPSTNNRNLVPEFAKKIASQLNLPFVNCVNKTKDNKPQKTMENTFWQKRNLDGAFSVNVDEIPENSNFLLVDDIVDSRWTLTIIGALLREAGAKKVLPFCLASQITKN